MFSFTARFVSEDDVQPVVCNWPCPAIALTALHNRTDRQRYLLKPMATLHSILVWLLFASLAIPLSCVALTSRRMARDLTRNADFDPHATVEGPRTDNGDGTFTQTITVSQLRSVSGYHSENFGPVVISANSRQWAANAVLIGLFLVMIGLVGLLHFPTQSAVQETQHNHPNNEI